ncbi:hypothetical protein BDY19DRAFT_984133 [Irpex rosettiformis]|uniref:Uncharacterized protein n=1 Tax=Irpex rosettiformis TaxID=378272 RepID=A0ACB8U9Z8_9APHY|nr:hypothetical protein BDY19DRAFT_984133 [Irpex rosettiformis]
MVVDDDDDDDDDSNDNNSRDDNRPGAIDTRAQSSDPPSISSGREAIESSLRQKVYVEHYPDVRAGAPIDDEVVPDANPFSAAHQGNPYLPFMSEMDWKIARWAKLRGQGSTAMSEMLSIPGLQDSLNLSYKNSRELNRIIDHQLPSHRPRFQRAEIELEGSTFDVYYRDVIACIRALFMDKTFAPYLVFAPERHYSDEWQENRLYHDMHTGKWWWTTQTQITLFGGKSMYPVYITIGNIPKQLRRKVSQQTQILLAYLPTTRLEHIINEAAKRRMVLNILHTALREILRPLHKAGLDGLNMTTGHGMTHRTHPILAAHVGDYMENIAIVGCKMGECPRCTVPFNELGDFELDYPLRNLREILDALATYDTDRNSFAHTCRNAGIKPIPHPYWEDLPFVDIFMVITPDILHQLYQGLVRHLISWIKKSYSHEQLDARIRCLPLNSHARSIVNSHGLY